MVEKELWLSHFSAQPWINPDVWDSYFQTIENLLDDNLERLDHRDPARRKVTGIAGSGAFITDFGASADRWILAKFRSSKIAVQIEHFSNGRDPYGRRRENSISFYVPRKYLRTDRHIQRIVSLFRTTGDVLGSFYGFCDKSSAVCSKKPSAPALTIDIAKELLGVFWLTYFGGAYRQLFGTDHLRALPCAVEETGRGTVLLLGQSPDQVSEAMRSRIEGILGRESFSGTDGSRRVYRRSLNLDEIVALERAAGEMAE